MDNRTIELLGYIRTLYERQNSKASKAGMTFWAILAGMVYVVWQLLQELSGLEVGQLSIFELYHSFGQIYLAVLSMSILIAFGGRSNSKRDLDYRVFREDGSNITIIILMLIFLGIPLYAVYQSMNSESISTFISWQSTVNFWSLAIILSISTIYFLYEFFAGKDRGFPPVATLISGSSNLTRVPNMLIALLFLEVFVGNVVNIAVDVYGSINVAKMHAAAFDTTLLMFGCFLLFRSGKTDERLDRFARFERDIIVHNISEKEILERLQDDYLGRYVGDWISDILLEVKEKAEALVEKSDGCDDLINDVNAIDEEYERERNGRVSDYLDELIEKKIHTLKV